MIWLCLSPFVLRSDQVSWLWALLWAKLDGLEFLSLVATNKMITSVKTKVALFCFYVAIEHDLLAQEVVGISNPVLGIEGSVPHKRLPLCKTQWCSFIPPHLKFRVFRNYKLKLMFSELNPIWVGLPNIMKAEYLPQLASSLNHDMSPYQTGSAGVPLRCRNSRSHIN